MFLSKKILSLFLFTITAISQSNAETDSNFYCFLCFGQSNMAGGNKPGNEEDCDTNPRVKVLAFMDCNTQSTACTSYRIDRRADQWYTAFPPYNNCSEGIGPSDYFGKTLMDSIREDIKIGFIPCALSGQDIGLFQKGNTSFTAPTWAHPTVGRDVYNWIVSRCRIAQQTGIIKGILFHQGENNAGDGDNWVNKVIDIVEDLKADLDLSDSIPFLAGELRYANQNGCCSQLNPYVNKLPSKITNCSVVSANGLEGRKPDDQYRAHFDTPGMRELGIRYAKAFLELSDNDYVPRIGTVNTKKERIPVRQAVLKSTGALNVYTINGRAVRFISAKGNSNSLRNISSSGVYIISRKLDNGQIANIPYFKQ